MSRILNFNPGPAMLPASVLEQMRDELMDYRGNGMSIMEMSHRGKVFIELAKQSEARLRRLMTIPDDYTVLFLPGGAQMMFSAVPMNLLRPNLPGGYVVTGSWSDKAVQSAAAYGEAKVLASSAERFDYAPAQSEWLAHDGLSYVHYTPNETIGGVEFHWTPDTGDVPLVADASSNILSRPMPVERHAVIYAGAQKNIGISGLALVIIRNDLLDVAPHATTPGVLNFKRQAGADSMLNTPATYPWYVANLVFGWLEDQGGVTEMATRNERKARTLYESIDNSNFYASPVRLSDRSRMNIPFTLVDSTLDGAFLAGAEAEGLSGLKGHRMVGGMRASIYNAMPQTGVEALVQFMAEFERTHG
ncbi:MAG: 3-phosphoserine/phosphohydroxythreonine transaminase [Chromatiales bacterium]|nr:3-phosphoserine/phosphohydroxythreonine transaminase [Chromatiales bacterium]